MLIEAEEVENETAESSQRLRLRLIEEGWRSLNDATDPRRKAAAEGATTTIAYWPQFKQLGVPAAMVKNGGEAPESAAWSETYVRGKGVWKPTT